MKSLAFRLLRSRFAWSSRLQAGAITIALLMGLASGCSQRRIFWGDVHGHTANSDGEGKVTDYLEYARDGADLDFVIVTDHDFGNGPPWRMPRAAWSAIQDAVEAVTVEGRFIAIAGYEWTSAPKYWQGFEGVSEGHFEGPPRHYNHKNVYFPEPVPYLFSSKDPVAMSPDLLAEAVSAVGGLVHNNHPTRGLEGRNQWDYDPRFEAVIANTSIDADVVFYEGAAYAIEVESQVREFLATGRKTGFVKGTDTHEGRPAARTALIASALTREALFEALRSRRCYAVSNARIVLDFKINGRWMGEEIETTGAPRILVDVQGTDRIEELVIVRDGEILLEVHPNQCRIRLQHVDETFSGESYYYVRVTQTDRDEHGNPSRAWSSPIWVRTY